MQVLPMGENDYMVFKTNPIMKNNIKEKQKPKIKSPPKQVKQNKTLFNNPFNDLTKLNV